MQQFLKFIFGIKLSMFRTVPLSITRIFSLYTQQCYMSYKFADSLRGGSGWNPGFIIRIYHDARSPERQISIINNALFCGLSYYSLVESYRHFGETSFFRAIYRE